MGYPNGERRRGRPRIEEEEDEPPATYEASFFATACWYLVPVLAYVAWALTLSSEPRAGCVDAFGEPCRAARAEALTKLYDNVPVVAIATAISIAVAMFLWRVTTGWRAWTIGFASAVLGASISTVVFAVVETQL